MFVKRCVPKPKLLSVRYWSLLRKMIYITQYRAILRLEGHRMYTIELLIVSNYFKHPRISNNDTYPKLTLTDPQDA